LDFPRRPPKSSRKSKPLHADPAQWFFDPYKLRTLRRLRGLAQVDVGLRLGINSRDARKAVSCYESYKEGYRTTPRPERLRAIADILDVRPEQLLSTGSEYKRNKRMYQDEKALLEYEAEKHLEMKKRRAHVRQERAKILLTLGEPDPPPVDVETADEALSEMLDLLNEAAGTYEG